MLESNYDPKSIVSRITLFALVPLSLTLLVLLASAVVSRTDHGTAAPATTPLSGKPAEFDSLVAVNTRVTDVPDGHPIRPVNENENGLIPSTPHIPAELVNLNSANELPEISRQPPVNLLKVDSLILEGQYSMAVDLLESDEPRASRLLNAQFQLRLALCAELQGNLPKALDHYRSLTGPSQSPEISDLAAVSSARVLIELDHRDAANALLMRLLLRRARTMSRDVLGDVVHTLAAGLVPVPDEMDLLDESQWLVAERDPTAEELLKSWSVRTETEPASALPEILELRQLQPSPEGVLVTLRTRTENPARLLDAICRQLNWSVSINVDVSKTLQSHSFAADCVELPLSVILDLLLKPIGFNWLYQEQRLTVTRVNNPAALSNNNAPADTSGEQQLQIADRFLQLAISRAPEHTAAPVSFVLLGSVTADLGDLDKAIHCFEYSIDRFPRSPCAGTSMVNLGRAFVRKGQREAALNQFYRTVDNVSGLEIDAVAYLYIGRILMENDEPRDAIAPLMRGLSLAERSKYEAPAALLLSSAYLLNGNALAANSILVEHRHSFAENETLSDAETTRCRAFSQQAAFLSSLARFWTSQGTLRIRDGEALLAALTNVQPDEMFGGQSAYLVGIAFGAVGLDSEQETVFQHSLSAPSRFPLQHRMESLLNGEIRLEESLQQRAVNESRITQDQSTPEVQARSSADKAILAKAEAAYRDSDYDEVLKTCQQYLLNVEPSQAALPATDPKSNEPSVCRAMLRLMGLAYQAQGQHEYAVRCLAGIAPALPTDVKPSRQSKEQSQ